MGLVAKHPQRGKRGPSTRRRSKARVESRSVGPTTRGRAASAQVRSVPEPSTGPSPPPVDSSVQLHNDSISGHCASFRGIDPQTVGYASQRHVLSHGDSISGDCAVIDDKDSCTEVKIVQSKAGPLELQQPFRIVFNAALTEAFTAILDNYTNLLEYETSEGALHLSCDADRRIALEAICSHCENSSLSRAESPDSVSSSEDIGSDIAASTTGEAIDVDWETVIGRKRGRGSASNSTDTRSPSPLGRASPDRNSPTRQDRPPRPSKRIILRPTESSFSESIRQVRHVLDSYTNLIRYNIMKGSRGDLIVSFCSVKAVEVAREALVAHASELFKIVPKRTLTGSASTTWTAMKSSWEIKISPTPRGLDSEALCEELKAEKFWILSHSKDLVLSFSSRDVAADLDRNGVAFEDLYLRAVPLHVASQRLPDFQRKLSNLPLGALWSLFFTSEVQMRFVSSLHRCVPYAKGSR